MKYTELILRNEEGEYSVKIEQTELNVDGIIDGLVVPLLMSAGYAGVSLATRITRV